SAAWLLDTARARMGGTCCSFSMSRRPTKGTGACVLRKWCRFSEIRNMALASSKCPGPPALPSQQRFLLTFRLLQWRWRLVGVTLPENIHNLLADELVKSVRALVQKP